MLCSVILLLSTCLYVQANTEIANFKVSEGQGLEFAFTKQWPILGSEQNELNGTLIPAALGTPLKEVCDGKHPGKRQIPTACPHEIWVVLDLAQSWYNFSKFTARLSWPASFPASFDIEIYTTSALLSYFDLSPNDVRETSAVVSQPRREYARVRVVDTGVVTPNPSAFRFPAPQENIHTGQRPIPFILLVEPLYLGILPSSIIPLLCYILLVLVFATFTVPKIECLFRQVANLAAKEIELGMKGKGAEGKDD